jgi:hypothetical protein
VDDTAHSALESLTEASERGGSISTLTQNMNDTLNISYAENRPFRQNKPNAGF